ncbi:hypothetical protein [Mycoplasma todarodis]|uniref:hypothetical protein n=1 Tax=Mycoplasma todarodis TaxID=1937191 RepID=UPI003B396AC3
MEELILEISVGVLVTLIAGFLIAFMFRPTMFFFLKKFRKDKDDMIEYTFFDKRIVKFSKKEMTRVSIGVLASIINEKGEVLLNHSKRPGRAWVPLGGCIKIKGELKEVIKKNKLKYTPDTKTPWSAKKDDMRIFTELSNNKKLQKILFGVSNKFYKRELRRELLEELKITKKEMNKIIKIETGQPQNIHIFAKSAKNSHSQMRDYLHQFIYKIKIIDVEKLNELVERDRDLSWIDLSKKNNKNIAITSFWIAHSNSNQKELK